jgi:hypothetical protein
MKCLNRVEVQEYIDNEADPSLSNEIVAHLEECENCSLVYKQAIDDKSKISRLLNELDSDDDLGSIPEFRHPILKRRKNSYFRLGLVLAAASIIGFIFLFRSDREPVTDKIPETEIIMYEFYEGKDLNKMWHDKSQIIILQDEKGNVIQSIITN